jgi:hypothetical protein
LNISGKSTDNPTADDCRVSVIVNYVKPYQSATANSNMGAKNDFSKWFFILGFNWESYYSLYLEYGLFCGLNYVFYSRTKRIYLTRYSGLR